MIDISDRQAQEREDHILDCYEVIKEKDDEIARLRAEVELWKDRHDAAVEAAQQMEHHFDEMWRQERG